MVIRLLVAATLCAALPTGAAAASLAPQERSVVSGADYQIVAAAVAAAPTAHRGPIEDYAIHIYENEINYIVVFVDPDRPDGRGGMSPTMFEFAVELNRSDLSPVRWHGIR